MTNEKAPARHIPLESIALLLGLVMLAAGLALWFGLAVALTVLGATLTLLGAWSAASDRRGGD